MPGFNCKNCHTDLSFHIDVFVNSLQAQYAETGEYPPDLFVSSKCHNCGVSFEWSGPMFTSFVVGRAEEGMVSDALDGYDIIDLAVSEEEYREFMRLNEEGSEEELEEFIRRLLLKNK